MPGTLFEFLWRITRRWSYPKRYACFGCDDGCYTAWLCIASGLLWRVLVIAWGVVLSALLLWPTWTLFDKLFSWTWDEWSECNDVPMNWAPVPSCSVTLSWLALTLCDAKRDLAVLLRRDISIAHAFIHAVRKLPAYLALLLARTSSDLHLALFLESFVLTLQWDYD